LLSALSHLDEVIAILRQASDGSTAKINLQSRFDLSEAQADAILAMPLRRLTSLEQQNLQTEFDSLNQQIQMLRRLLSDRRELLKALKKDLRSLKRKYSDGRRTRIGVTGKGSGVREQTEPRSKSKREEPITTEKPKVEEAVLEFTQRGYVRRSAANNQRSARKQKADSGMPDNDLVIQSQITKTEENLVVMTDGGKVYPVKVGDIPPTNGRARGTPLISLLPNAAASSPESLVTQFLLPNEPETAQLLIVTKLGRIKRLSMTDLVDLTSRGLTVIKLKDDDQLLSAQIAQTGQDVVLATAGGRLLRFKVNDEQLPIMGRTAVGLQALRLRKQEQLVSGVTVSNSDANLLLVSQLGYAKRMPVSALRRANRGDIGTQALSFISKSDALAAMVLAPEEAEVAFVTNNQRVVRIPMDSVNLWGKEGKGDRLPSLKENEKITTVTLLAPIPS
jgi:DNA gyrase subunit A